MTINEIIAGLQTLEASGVAGGAYADGIEKAVHRLAYVYSCEHDQMGNDPTNALIDLGHTVATAGPERLRA